MSPFPLIMMIGTLFLARTSRARLNPSSPPSRTSSVMRSTRLLVEDCQQAGAVGRLADGIPFRLEARPRAAGAPRPRRRRSGCGRVLIEPSSSADRGSGASRRPEIGPGRVAGSPIQSCTNLHKCSTPPKPSPGKQFSTGLRASRSRSIRWDGRSLAPLWSAYSRWPALRLRWRKGGRGVPTPLCALPWS